MEFIEKNKKEIDEILLIETYGNFDEQSGQVQKFILKKEHDQKIANNIAIFSTIATILSTIVTLISIFK